MNDVNSRTPPPDAVAADDEGLPGDALEPPQDTPPVRLPEDKPLLEIGGNEIFRIGLWSCGAVLLLRLGMDMTQERNLGFIRSIFTSPLYVLAVAAGVAAVVLMVTPVLCVVLASLRRGMNLAMPERPFLYIAVPLLWMVLAYPFWAALGPEGPF